MSELVTDDPAREATQRQPHISSVEQWRALTTRTLRSKLKSGEFFIAIIAPMIFTIGFYLPLKLVMGLQGIHYAQFVMAIIVLQTMSFTMTSCASLAATEAVTGFSARLQTMPVKPLVPLAARMSAAFVQLVVSLCAAVGFGYAIGFRLGGGLGQSAAFCAFALAVGFGLCLGADAIGMLTRSPESVSQAMTLPVLIFGMLSTGFVPETGFPAWIRPFARNQPISQFSYALRDFADPGMSASVLIPAFIWLAGALVVLFPLAIWATGRRE